MGENLHNLVTLVRNNMYADMALENETVENYCKTPYDANRVTG
jgi:hypothetical protein